MDDVEAKTNVEILQTTIAAKPVKYVVFMFNTKDNAVSEILSEHDNITDAVKEVCNLRKQGIPAYYSSKGYYIEITGKR